MPAREIAKDECLCCWFRRAVVVKMQPGLVLGQTVTAGAPDFPGDDTASTYSIGGPGKLMTCMKCPECGWSVSL